MVASFPAFSGTAVALADCDSFYASAEAIFQPWLRDQPIVVLSANDGNVIARNAPAKALGIMMGQPWHEVAPLHRQGQVNVFSSNYALYQSISDRVMMLLGQQAARIEVYSIDEAWLDASGMPGDLEAWGRDVRGTVLKHLGMPIGIGIGTTKTMAKLANWGAKRWASQTGNVVDIRDSRRLEKLLRVAPVNEVWGIGSRLSRRLSQDLAISTAWGLATADRRLLRRHYGVTVERTSRELLGERCFGIEEGPEPKQQIISSQAFGRRVYDQDSLGAAIATYVARGAAKLRRQGSLTHCLQVFVQTSPFARSGEPYSAREIVAYPSPTDDTRELVTGAMTALARIYKPGPAYSKAGIILTQFVPAKHRTEDLFASGRRPNSQKVMATMDAINEKMGRGAVRLAREEVQSGWEMRRQFLSPAYTTRWVDLPKAH